MSWYILSSILESDQDDHVCILGDFNAAPGSPQFNEICDMIHENNVSEILIFIQITLTRMLIMVAIHVHG